MQIPVHIGVKGQAILGMLHLPKNRAEGSPVILLCCGFDGKRTEVHQMATCAARKAEEAGVAMLRFDYRGLGVSDDEFWHTSIRHKIEDTLAIIDFIKGCFQGEQFTLIPLGFSDGARIAAGLYKQRDFIGGLAFWSPVFYSMAGDVHEKANVRIARHPVTKELVFPRFGVWQGMEYLREQTSMGNAIHELSDFTGPVLAVFGGADHYIKNTCQEFASLAAENGGNWKTATIEGANHIFNRLVWAESVIEVTIDWAIEVGKTGLDHPSGQPRLSAGAR